jgi:uncharacterized protein YjdB
MKKLLLLFAFLCSFGSAFAFPSGDTIACVGSTINLSSHWPYPYVVHFFMSSDPSVATIDSFSGVVHAIAPGTTQIYAAGTGPAPSGSFYTVHVYPSLSSFITGDSGICQGASVSLTISVSGGVWIGTDPSIIDVNSSTGVVTGLSGGVANVYYMLSGACASRPVRVASWHADSGMVFSPAMPHTCVGTTIHIAPASYLTSFGVWSSSNASVATVSSDPFASGWANVTGVALGTANISYTSVSYIGSASCLDTVTHYHTITVGGTIPAPPITGRHTACIGYEDSLTNAIDLGSWSTDGSPAVSPYPSFGIIGVFNAVAIGTTTVTYTYPVSACTSTPYTTFDITVFASDSTNTAHITGPSVVCAGSSASFYASIAGGDWSTPSGYESIASVDASGLVSGLMEGYTGVLYNVYTSVCGFSTDYRSFNVLPAPDAGTITGPSALCFGIADTFNASVSGGAWSIAPLAGASVSSGGVVAASTPGTYSVMYSVTNSCGTDIDTAHVSVVAPPVPSPIYASSPTMCIGGTITLSDTLGGGTWHSSDSAVIHLGATTYWSTVASPLSIGTAIITYTYTGMCAGTAISSSVTATYTTSGYVSAGTISGPSSVCDGASFILSSSSPGGVWTSASPLVATIDATGTVYTTSSGTAIISYEISGLCNAAVVTDTIAVNATTSPGTISGATSVMEGYTIPLAATVSGGVWSVSSSVIASIDATTGVLHGLSAGSVTVTYTPSGCYSPAFVTYNVTVVPADVISGSVYFAPTTYTGNIRVWLIAYSAPMLTAIDSVDIYSPGSSAAYQFLNEPAGTYRIKAAPLDGPLTGTGFIPTYFTSSMYWNTADVVTHVTGTVNAGNNINLMTGTITSGPGFIGGDVTTGANKGTSTGMPVDGLMMYLLDATNTLYQSTRTDAAGHYSFSNIPSGTYYVFPDSLNYATTPYTGIVITSGSPTYSAASFIQHTLSKTITPIPVGISTVTTSNTSVVVFPNPTSGKVNIAWQVSSSQKAEMIVSDITGRVVISNTLDMAAGAGSAVVDLGNLVSGLYTVTVKSADLNYNTKIQVQH